MGHPRRGYEPPSSPKQNVGDGSLVVPVLSEIAENEIFVCVFAPPDCDVPLYFCCVFARVCLQLVTTASPSTRSSTAASRSST